MTLLPIELAKKDGTPVLLQLKDQLPREDLKPWQGLQFVGRHEPLPADGFDVGWQFAAPVGQGGFPDDWIEGWRPLTAGKNLTTQGEELIEAEKRVRELIAYHFETPGGDGGLFLAKSVADEHFNDCRVLADALQALIDRP